MITQDPPMVPILKHKISRTINLFQSIVGAMKVPIIQLLSLIFGAEHAY